MNREVITEISFRESTTRLIDDYKDRLVKMIPAEIVAAYLTLKGILDSAIGLYGINPIQWGVLIILIILTPIIYHRLYDVNSKLQLVLTTVAFIIWVFTIGSPLDTFFISDGEISPLKGVSASILLVLFTLITPLLKK